MTALAAPDLGEAAAVDSDRRVEFWLSMNRAR